MLGSTLLSSVLSIWSQSRKAKAEEQKLLITRGEFQMKSKKQSLDHSLKDKGFASYINRNFPLGFLVSFGYKNTPPSSKFL